MNSLQERSYLQELNARACLYSAATTEGIRRLSVRDAIEDLAAWAILHAARYLYCIWSGSAHGAEELTIRMMEALRANDVLWTLDEEDFCLLVGCALEMAAVVRRDIRRPALPIDAGDIRLYLEVVWEVTRKALRKHQRLPTEVELRGFMMQHFVRKIVKQRRMPNNRQYQKWLKDIENMF